MAQKQDVFLPYNDLTKYIPNQLRNPVNVGLLDNLFNRFMTKDESVPMYGYIGSKPTSSFDRSARIPQLSVERDLNAIVPVLNFKVGSETVAFTVEDLLNKAKVQGMDTGDHAWLYSQGNNFKPPISFDKFTNFFDYYWVASEVSSTAHHAWNPEGLPEYYVVAAPLASDADKLNCVVASNADIVRTGSGFLDQTFTLTFTSAGAFSVSLSAALSGPGGLYTPILVNRTNTALGAGVLSTLTTGLTNPTDVVETFAVEVTRPGSVVELVRFNITREPKFNAANVHVGYTGFSAGDVFHIQTAMLSSNYNISYSIGPGVKGKISGVKTLDVYQTIDDVVVGAGDRVLVKNQTTASENGIYKVSSQGWTRTADLSGSNLVAGARVFVVGGSTNGSNGSKLWNNGVAGSGGSPFVWSVIGSGVDASSTSDWQEGNYWVKGSELAGLGIDRANVVQALRPIIEFNGALQLNVAVNALGVPCGAGDVGAVSYHQRKTEFNQLPLFDLFRYDGTHSGLVSSIFYYVEDLAAELDVPLQKRLKLSTNASADLLFNHGCADADGNLLFFKLQTAAGTELKTVWQAGPLGPGIIDTAYTGIGNGVLSGLVAGDTSQQQTWTLTATSPTTFKVVGSKMPVTPDATVGTAYTNGELSFTINAGSTAFHVGDTFTVRVANLERPRYSFRAADESVQDLYGGAVGDVTGKGAFQLSRTFYNNPYNDSRAELTEGSLYSHFRSILNTGVTVGSGTTLPVDYSLGGNIKLWSEQHTLLASILMQRDFTLTSMIEMAKRQYDTGLNTLRDIYQKSIVEYFSTGKVVTVGDSAGVTGLVDYLLAKRSLDMDTKTVLFDSTSGVTGFPITLPQMGLATPVSPYQLFDKVLGINVLVHHDGHLSGLYLDTFEFRDSILGNYVSKQVVRSDGTSTPAVGSFNATAPVTPYRGELWLKTVNNITDIFAYDVQYDTELQPVGAIAGALWYQRSTNTLKVFGGVLWTVVPDPTSAWVPVDLAALINAVLLQVEERLYANINVTQRQYDFTQVLSEPVFQGELQRELFNFAALNNLDPLGTNYSATDSFTWNYSLGNVGNFPPGLSVVPARWYSVLKAHQSTITGVIPTERPDVEPWKLFGFSTLAQWQSWVGFNPAWISHVALPDLSSGYSFSGYVRAVQTQNVVTFLSGLQTIDGVSLNNGDFVLLQNELSPANNGLYAVSSGVWTRVGTLALHSYVQVTEGTLYANTAWYISTAPVTLNVDPVYFTQARYWSTSMWTAISTLHPALKISVNPITDELLPPYVSSTLPTSVYALTTAIPPGVALPFDFGEGSPVEEVWFRSNEYRYALAKALARYDPLALLGFAWGFNWVEVDGIKYDGFDINMPGHKRGRLHGDAVPTISRTGALVGSAVNSGVPFTATFTYDAYDSSSRQSFSVRVNGAKVGIVQEGVSFSVSGITGLIDDWGQPFHSGDMFTLTGSVATFTPATYHQIRGLGQTFTNALREISVDTKSSYAINAYRDWEVNMGFRAGSLLTTDDLTIYNDTDTLNASSYSLLLKKNEVARDAWLQSLRVTVYQYGAKVMTPPAQVGAQYRGTETNAPVGSGDDWVFRIEGYNPRYTQLDYNILAPIVSGTSFPATAAIGATFFRHDLGNLYTFNGTAWTITTSTALETFNVLDKTATPLTFFKPTSITGKATALLPITITGVQNLVSFLFSYASWADAEGWRFSHDGEYNYDQATGRTRDWQLEVERMLDGIYRGLDLGVGVIINPFIDRVWIEQDTGILSEFVENSIFDITGNPGVYDMAGTRYPRADLRPVRGNLASSIAAVGPMFSVHAQFDEFEHLFIFGDYINASLGDGLLYDAFSGSRAVTYKFIGHRAANQTLRPEFGGHYNSQGLVLQNLQASTDTLANSYDANYAFDTVLTSTHALALLGFSPKTYLSNLDISDKTQFNFWRGLIQSKGTNLSVDAYLNNDRFQDAKIDEYWAYKIAEYGDSRQLSYPELRIEVADCLQQFTQLQFDYVSTLTDPAPLTNYTQVSRLDESRWFSIDDLDQDAYFKAEQVGVYTKEVVSGEVVTLPFIADKLVITGSATQVNTTTLVATGTGTLTVVGYGPAVPRYNPIKLFNYEAAELVQEIPHWHPATGQHNPTALESINIIGDIDPARYTYSTLVQGNVSYDPLRPWGDRELGRVWFDTRNLAYVPYYDQTIFPNRAERLSRWGTVADYATIDVYEWVKSSVPPAGYAALAAVEALDADISSSSKASGEVALQETYSRDRIWSIRPVAWSKTGSVFGGHPAFDNSYNAILTAIGDTYTLDRQTFADYGVSVGMRIGAWDPNTADPKPVSEAIVAARTTVVKYDPAFTGISGNFTVSVSPTTYKADAAGDYLFAIVPVTQTITVDPGQPYIAPNPGQPYIQAVAPQEFRPATSGQPLVASVAGQPYIPPNPGQPFIAEVVGQPYIAPIPEQPFIAANPGQPHIAAVVGQPYIAPVVGQPFIAEVVGQPYIAPSPEILASSGYQVVRFGPSKSNSDATGLVGATTYTASIAVDGTSYPISILGSAAPTFQTLISAINAALPGSPVSLNADGDLVVLSPSLGAASTVAISDGTLFAALQDFDSIQPAFAGVPYAAAVAGQPYIAAVVGQPFIASVPEQPYIASVPEQPYVAPTVGQPYIAPVPEQPYIAHVPEQPYIAPTAGQPYIAPVQGQEYIQADPGQPHIDEVVGQPYIAPTVGQPYIAPTYQTVTLPTAFSPQPGGSYVATTKLRIVNTTTNVEEIITLSTVACTGLESDPYHGAQIELEAQQVLTFVSETFGLSISMLCGTAGAYTPGSISEALQAALYTYVTILDGIIVTPVVALPTLPLPGILCNDPTNPIFTTNGGIGWRAWSIPTQALLDADGQQPLAIFKPYLGDYRTLATLSQAQLADAIAYSSTPLTLNDGTVVDRYSTTWTDWTQLNDVMYPISASPVSVYGGSVTFVHTENIVANRTTVYVNGIAQLKSAYSIVGTDLTVSSVPVGHTCTAIIRKYSPSAAELAFNPDVTDNLTFQRQYKRDYEYSQVSVRGTDGTPTTTYYYFWVKNRAVTAYNKKLSTQAIATNLSSGPPSYLTFQHLIGTGTLADLYRYDAITVSGLSYLVTKDSTFKLRFTRNFTLRDDPQQLELKNTHTEWGLIRSTQKVKIPELLWNKLVDSMAGQDAAGNTIPSLRRSLYDERTGSSISYGFGPEQTLAPFRLLRSSVTQAILNTKLTTTTATGTIVPDFISVLDFTHKELWFADSVAVRQTMTSIWNGASATQVNEIFFAALEDILANNLEMTDIFKTSRLSAYSTRTVTQGVSVPVYE